MSVAVLYSSEHSAWVRYERPRAIFVARRHEEVPALLAHLEAEVEKGGLHAVGFLAYEAGRAFDPAMPRACCGDFPLAWFGLFESPATISLGPSKPGHALDWVSELDAGAHGRALERIRGYLARGETYQVNFTHRLRARFDMDPWDFFGRLVSRQPSPHAAFLDTADFALCSASPEMFFERDGEEIWSRPMKGTAPRGRWREEDEALARGLAVSEKERAENVMIVDMVRNDLGRICLPGSVHVPELFRAERYPTLWQLTSLVSGRTRESTAQVMAALFPAASITGAPKVRTMNIIEELEISPRRIYTGCIGVISPGRKARFNVAIRTVLVEKSLGMAEYGVGGGIVWDSDPGAEFRETRIKARVLADPEPEFSLLETMRWARGEGIFLLDEHLLRLKESAAYFGFRFDQKALREALLREISAACGMEGVLRLTMDVAGVWSIEHRPLPGPSPCRVSLALSAVDAADPFLFHKTTRRAVYDQAKAQVAGVDDVLLWNGRCEVTESTIANLVVELDGELLTPSLACGLLPGTMRARLLQEGRIREDVVLVDDLPRCTRLWLINSVRGWRECVLAGPVPGSA
ncbi:para-aminobenzoate synthetase/4-amino-4-deoxychorismate lyase [Desulfomicrobium macestii]|uniref:Para-aminobenzoate synthetase/4-amino-4-deoxychorismate lyase n=1 Tax=Desulfomicrobium macestii TaxID=90731 RepID=A0ABR9H8B9_9BACT|nr:aminodeoxychorismate synthase component I [Desulfomicrobium macestii]MBE1426793.1 para-aminobenzoate synthetase/4-amino-4-deoxychorismate lyase [Desulfomicrobium macestii]